MSAWRACGVVGEARLASLLRKQGQGAFACNPRSVPTARAEGWDFDSVAVVPGLRPTGTSALPGSSLLRACKLSWRNCGLIALPPDLWETTPDNGETRVRAAVRSPPLSPSQPFVAQGMSPCSTMRARTASATSATSSSRLSGLRELVTPDQMSLPSGNS